MGYQERKQFNHSAEYVALKGCPLGRSSKGKDQVKLGVISYRWSSESTHVPLIFLAPRFLPRSTYNPTHTYARYIIVALDLRSHRLRSVHLQKTGGHRLSSYTSFDGEGSTVFPEFLQFSLSNRPPRRLLWLFEKTVLSNRSSSNILVKRTRSETLLYYITISLRRPP